MSAGPATARTSTAATSRRVGAGFRPEIQGLRAIAVAAVVVYHVWPWALPGGFVGVDVFFVVSGFLITQHIVAEVDRTGRLSVMRFWARRIRRLLPAAFLVLAASLVIMLFVVPATRWQQTVIEIAASAGYVQNWVLAAASIDYLAAENDSSVVQHYWSLSVEEQFYLLWPLLIMALLGIATALRALGRMISTRRMLGIGLGAVAAASIAHSIVLTASEPGIAYFSTATRAWEFAAGGLLAILAHRVTPSPGSGLAIGVSWAGFGLIAASVVVIDGQTPFPGIAAALPVLGTVLAMAGGYSTRPIAPSRLLANRPTQLLGDISYSVYLWHWPLVVAYPLLRGNAPGILGGLTLIATTIVLAGLTKRYVEDPLRASTSIIGAPRRAFALALVGILAFIGVAGAATLAIQADAASREETVASLDDCLGARSLHPEAPAACLALLEEAPVVPGLAGRKADTGEQYDCYVPEGGSFSTCRYGLEEAPVRLAITGDSHAASLIPGLRALVEERGWLLDTYVGFGCQLAPGRACLALSEFEAAIVEGDYDAVLATGTSRLHPEVDVLVEHWGSFIERGVPIVPVVDVPYLPEQIDACIEASGGDQQRLADCRIPRDTALGDRPDRYGPAARELGIPAIDLTDLLCDDDACPTVIGSVLVYRDSPASHLTATFSRTLADRWGAELDRVLDRG